MSFISGLKRGVSNAAHTVQKKAVQLAKNPAKAAETAKKAYDTFNKVKSSTKDAFDGMKEKLKDNTGKDLGGPDEKEVK